VSGHKQPAKNPRTRTLVSLSFLLVICVGFACAAEAATVTANSCALSDVQAAIRRAANGDTVQVPSGTCSWTGTLSLSKPIFLKASGAVTIIDNYSAAEDLVRITESAAGNIRVSGFIWQYGVGPNTTYGNAVIGMYPGNNGKPILIDHNTFNMSTSGNSIKAGTNKGVIWNNTFTGQIGSTGGTGCYCNNASALRHKLSAAQNSSWTTPAVYGTADANGDQNLYFESNTLKLVLEGIDVDDNARTIIRYNTLENSAIIHHGADTSGSGARSSEIYNNNFSWNPNAGATDLPPNVNGFITIRGGTTLVHDNVIPDISGNTWGDKSEVQLLVENPWRNAGPYACWKEGYPVPHQTAWGFTTGGTKRTSEVFQDSEPIYFWNNTGTGNYDGPSVGGYGPDECHNNAPPPDSFIQANRDYFTGRAKSGYTPYRYPHPLTGEGQ